MALGYVLLHLTIESLLKASFSSSVRPSILAMTSREPAATAESANACQLELMTALASGIRALCPPSLHSSPDVYSLRLTQLLRPLELVTSLVVVVTGRRCDVSP